MKLFSSLIFYLLLGSLTVLLGKEFTDSEKAVLGFEGTGWSGITYTDTKVKEGAKAALWDNHVKNASVTSKEIPHDWSEFNELHMWLYNEKVTGEDINLILASKKDEKVNSYFFYLIKAPAQGWQELVIPFSKFSASRSPAGWNKIDSIQFNVDGWGLKPNPESVIIFDALSLVSGESKKVTLEIKDKPLMIANSNRILEIASYLPSKPLPVLLAPAADRKIWEGIDPEKAKALVDAAELKLKNGMPAWNDELYLAYTKLGKRTGDAMMGSRTGYLTSLVMAEAIEHKGRFIKGICEAVESIASDKSWTLPAHDGNLVNYNGKDCEIDLSVASRALVFSGTLKMLENELPVETQKLLRSELERHVFTPYRKRFSAGTSQFWWMNGDNNWNAVCHAGVVLAALSVLEDPKDRAMFINGAEQGVPWFLHGMPDDGYCTEGIGYWGYGFGNYVLLALGIREATGGKIDWFKNEKVMAIGRFGRKMELLNNTFPAYGDCSPVAKPSPMILYVMDRLYDPNQLPSWTTKGTPLSTIDPQNFCQTYLPSSLYRTITPETTLTVKKGENLRDFFNIAGILNVRPLDASAKDALAASFKGGHNAEEHNHNDTGSFVISTPKSELPLILDPGSEVYTARTFSARRYESKALSSWGHSIPMIGGQQQRPGRDSEAIILETSFKPELDKIVMDLTSGYDEVKGLTQLKRTFIYQRSPNVLVKIIDDMIADKPLSFSTALMTYNQWKQTGPKTLIFYNSVEALEVTFDSSSDKPLVFKESLIDEDMGYKQKPTRVGIEIVGEHKTVQLTTSIRSIENPFSDTSKRFSARSENLGIFEPNEAKAIKLEAEAFTAQSGGTVEVVTKIGASGSAFKGWDEAGHQLSWEVSIPQTSDYALQLRHCGMSLASRGFLIDNKPVDGFTNFFQIESTGGFSSDKDNWKNDYLAGPNGGIRIRLTEGKHLLTLTSSGGPMNLDWLKLVPAAGKYALNVNPTLVDSKNTGVPEGWTYGPPPDGKATKALLTTENGKTTLTLSDRDKDNGLGLQQLLTVNSGKTYRQSAKLKGDDINFYFIWLDKDKKAIGKEIIQTLKAGKDNFIDSGWEQNAPANAEFLKFWIYSAKGAQGETQIQEPAIEEVNSN